MIQRIQTLYLLIVAIITTIIPFYLGSKLIFGFLICSLLAIISIFSYKKRQNQFVINRLNIGCNLILIVFIILQNLQLIESKFIISESIFIKFLPIIIIIFLVLANKSIKKDDNLVKSSDRLR